MLLPFLGSVIDLQMKKTLHLKYWINDLFYPDDKKFLLNGGDWISEIITCTIIVKKDLYIGGMQPTAFGNVFGVHRNDFVQV